MAPAAKRLAQLLETEVQLAPDCIGPEVQACVEKMQSGDILLLENLRFHDGETKNDPQFARQLADLADVYINDAFAVSHRAHASVEGITHFVGECAAGLLLQKEMDYFNRSISHAARPLVAVLGGAKVSSKLGAIRNMLDRVDKMIIGGAMANTFIKSQGFQTGSSLVEDDLLETARELIALAREKGVQLYLPVDCIVADRFTPDAATKKVTIQDIPENWMALDIGPATSILFNEALDDAQTIVWNGPMGAFEMAAYAKGSYAMVQSLTSSNAMTVVGGGDTNALVNQAGAGQDVSYMSTGGGAFLMLMEGKDLPGVTALEEKV
jgi:phosphoglycerate kinase